MTFPSDIALREQPLSAELYTFTFSSGNVLYYTSYESDVAFGGHTYVHVPIERSEIPVDDSLSSDRIKITAPVLNTWASMGIQSGQISVLIVKLFIADGSSQTILNGLLLNIKKNVGQGEAEACSKMYYLEKELPRVFFQSACNNSLFDDFCKGQKTPDANTVTRANYGYSLLVTVSNNGYTLTIDKTAYVNFVNDFTTKHGFGPPLIGTPLKAYFTLGRCSYAGEVRYVTLQVGIVLSLHYPFHNLTAGSVTVDLLPGCDKTGSYCRGIFGDVAVSGNILNFTGFPYCPTDDCTVQAVGT